MWDTLYSLTLLMALSLGALALLASVASKILRTELLQRLILPFSLGALGSLAASFGVHLAFGHRPGTPQALSPLSFLAIHPAFMVALALPCLALIVTRVRSPTVESDGSR